MNSLPSCNLLDKARRHHRRAMLKDPSLPALVAGGGKVVSNGHLSAALPLVDGTVAVYGATPSIEWQFTREAPANRKACLSVVEWDAISDANRVKGHVDAALNILAAIDRRAAQVEARPTAIAAE